MVEWNASGPESEPRTRSSAPASRSFSGANFKVRGEQACEGPAFACCPTLFPSSLSIASRPQPKGNQGHDRMLYLALGADGALRKEHQLQPARTAFAEGNALEGPSPLVTG